MPEMNGVNYGSHNESSDWLKVLGGAAGGYLFGRWQENNRGGRGNNNGAPYGEAPVATPYAAPYGGCGCSENTPVNRFELQQEKEIAAREAKIAKLESEKYTDQVGIQLFERITEMMNRANDKQDFAIADLTKSSVKTAVEVRGLADDVKYGAKTTAREFESIEAQVNREFKHSRELSDRLYVGQPMVKICADDYTLKCASCTED